MLYAGIGLVGAAAVRCNYRCISLESERKRKREKGIGDVESERVLEWS